MQTMNAARYLIKVDKRLKAEESGALTDTGLTPYGASTRTSICCPRAISSVER